VGAATIKAPFDGVLRGLLKDGLPVSEGEKVGDIDPRPDIDVHTISDKARAVSGGVLEAIFSSIPWTLKPRNAG
jgi:xanthine dehydrogenase accessory factor